MTISNVGPNITITGSETGDALRAYMIANAIGFVIDRDIIFDGDLIIEAGNTLSDENSVHLFRGNARFLQNGGVTNYNNVVVKMTENSKGFGSTCPGGELNWTNSFYIIATSGGRTDFFNSNIAPNLSGTLSNVALVADGFHFMHIYGSPTNRADYTGVTLDVDTGCSFQQATLSDSVFTSNFSDVFCDFGEILFIRLRWERDDWNFARDNNGAGSGRFVDPIKPATWTGYTYNPKFGSVQLSGTNTEEYTHEVTVLDTDGNSVDGASLKLTNTDLDQDVYDVLTGSDGKITVQNVLTHVSPNTYYSDFDFGVWVYGKTPVVATRPFSSFPPENSSGFYDGRISERIIAISDSSATEQDVAVVQAYPFSVSIAGSTVTVTGDSSTLQAVTARQLYDALHEYEVSNQLRTRPSQRQGDTINLLSLDVVLDFITFQDSLTTTGSVTLSNGSSIAGVVVNDTQDSTLLEVNGSSFSVYANEADRDSRTNAIATNVTSFPFLFANAPAPTLFLWVAFGDTELPASKVLAQGTNEIDLGVAGAITALSGQVALVLEDTDELQENQGDWVGATTSEIRADLERGGGVLALASASAGLARDHARAANQQTQRPIS